MVSALSEDMNSFLKLPFSFADHTKFEGNVADRQIQREAFIDGKIYVPRYDYPKLVALYDLDTPSTYFSTLKGRFYEGYLYLNAALDDSAKDSSVIELYRDAHEYRLKRMLLVEAARRIATARSSASSYTASLDFRHTNHELYGAFNNVLFLDIVAEAKDLILAFAPKHEREKALQQYLSDFLAKDFTVPKTRRAYLLDAKKMSELHKLVVKTYEKALKTIPDTDDSVYYDAEQSIVLLNDFMKISGLTEHGWTSAVRTDKVRPVTDNTQKMIYLPKTLHRTSRELKRLFIHEAEVHARRSQNGSTYRRDILRAGTAGFADAEEGLGVLLECAIEGTFNVPSFHRAQDRYLTLGLALGADGHGKRDAREVFEILWRIFCIRDSNEGTVSDELIELSKNAAYEHIENAFRGTSFWRAGEVFLKPKVYYEGLIKNIRYFAEAENIEQAFNQAMLGKYNHTDPRQRALISDIIESDTDSHEEE